MAEMVAFNIRFSGMKPIFGASSYSGGEMLILRIMQYASNCLDDSVLVFLLSIGVELGTEERIYSLPVIGSIELNYDGVITIN
uniref:Uncharacterized protein n=1 Tax=Romanomermis culicivorax TaxID=13658 RepID=A0A915K1A3_ROMCU